MKAYTKTQLIERYKLIKSTMPDYPPLYESWTPWIVSRKRFMNIRQILRGMRYDPDRMRNKK